MKLVLISDTHNRIEEGYKLPSGDVLIHAGDLTMGGTKREVERALEWLTFVGKDFQHVLLVAGNHDFYFEDAMNHMDEVSDSHALKSNYNITYLRDSGVEIEGKKFYGSPWQPEFGGWAFNLPRGTELRKKWDMIPRNTDVLITHGPPKGILDVSGPRYGSMSVGDEELAKVVGLVSPKVHVFGHIHGSYGVHLKNWGDGPDTVFVNASQVDEDYAPVNVPIVVNL